MIRVTLGGPEVEGLLIEEPAASVRLLLPAAGADQLTMPTWSGNEFLLPDRRRPTIRTFTPRRLDLEALELDLEVVVHGGGAASGWADTATPGQPAAISGPGRGYAIDAGASSFLLAGDETAIPAISQLLEALPAYIMVKVHIEVAHPDGRLDLPAHPRAAVAWHDLPAGSPPCHALVAAVRSTELAPGTQVWAAGEAAGVQRIRRHLFEDLGLLRTQAHVRGYWKHGRTAGADDA